MKFLKKYWWFLALIVICALFLVQRICTRNTNLRQFTITNAEAIDGIFISKGSDSISINKNKEGWILEGKQVDSMAIKSLFNVLTNIETNAPITSFQADSIVEEVKMNGALIKVFSNGRIKLDTYAFYSDKFSNNIFVNNRTGIPYFVDLMGYSGSIADLFITEKSYWTGNKIFSIPISKVSKIEVDIPQNPESSYIIGIANGSFELIKKATGEKVSNLNTNRLSRFTSDLGNLAVTKLSTDRQNLVADELKSVQSMRIITLYSELQTSQIVLYPIKVDKINELGVRIEFDPNRFYIVYSDNQVAEATYVNFSSVLMDIPDLVVKN